MKNNQPKNITNELYQKNVDLVHANNTLQLLQDLYKITIKNLNLKSSAQRFIDLITSKLGFPDGLIVLKNKNEESLQITAITQTQINQTILSLSGLQNDQLVIPLSVKNNAFVKAYESSLPQTINGVIDLWTPLVKPDDLVGVDDIFMNQNNYVYPIIAADKHLGCFSVSLDEKVQSLTEYQINTLTQVGSVLSIALDRITIYQELQESQARELAKAKEVIKLKDEFVFIATHDLRTPVTAFMGYLDLIKKESNNFSDELKENIKAIEEAGNRLNQLVDDLLEVSRSESGTLKIDLIPVDAIKIINESIRQVEIPAQGKNVKIKSNLDQQNKMILGDPDKFAEIMENLLSNAVKFNKPNGNISIETKRIANSLQFTVSDTGWGIPDSEHDKVFQKFFKYRGDDTMSVPGTGLGLFVVRMLLQKMNGDIVFKSKKGEGTTFVFTIPLANST